MATNYVHSGDVLELTAPRTVTSGEGALVGKIFGVALNGYTSADTLCAFAVKGVFDIAKDSSTFAQGDNVYWDNSAFAATSTAGSNVLIGQAEAAAATGVATVRVRLTSQPMVVDVSGAGVTASAAEINTLTSVTAGTAKASAALVLNSVKSVDLLQATTQISVGGTGVPGAAGVETFVTKKVTGLTDTVATAVLTVTVPNSAHAALIDVDVLGILGASGTIGASEAVKLSKYQIALCRTAGVAVVPAVSSAIGGVATNVVGATSVASVVVTVSTITGAVSATQTFTINVAITKTGGASDAHVALIAARIVNSLATGVTIA